MLRGKIEELKKSGVPEKYWAELARRPVANSPHLVGA